MKKKKMNYNRVMNDRIVKLLECEYRWLVDFVKQRKDLDFQTGSDWFSIYRGTARIFKVTSSGRISAHQKYMQMEPDLYKKPSERLFISLIDKIKNYVCLEGKNSGKNTLKRYYDNEREGFYQNNISRRYGLCGKGDDVLIIIDKEAVVAFEKEDIKNNILEPLKNHYRKIAKEILEKEELRFPSKLDETSFGNECDFIALTKKGELILMELKDGKDTQKIYLSPFQISMYCDIFNHCDKESDDKFRETILKMVKQKQGMGLLNPLWTTPNKITKILAALVVGGDYSKAASEKYNIVRQYINKYDIITYTTHGDSGELKAETL
jgi:hypothetical protein